MVDQASNPDITEQTQITDEAVDKFFETGGDEASLSKDEAPPDAEPTEPKKENDKDESEPEESAKPKEERKVSYGALHEERVRRRELEGQVQEIQRKNQRMEEAFQQMVLRMQYPQQQQQAPQPQYDDDPVGTLKAKQENLERFLMQQAQEHQRQQQAEEAQKQFINRYHQSAEAYLKDRPDFKEAYQYLNQSRLQEFSEAGFTFDEAKRLLEEDEAVIVAKAYRDGVNPAERLYKIAKNRGFNKPANQDAKINQLERGVNASKSLSNAPGKSKVTLRRLEEVAELPDDEFAKVDWDELMKQFG